MTILAFRVPKTGAPSYVSDFGIIRISDETLAKAGIWNRRRKIIREFEHDIDVIAQIEWELGGLLTEA